MNLLIIGAGMYVTGRQGTGVGTVLASVMQALGNNLPHSIMVCAMSPANAAIVAEAVARIGQALGSDQQVTYTAYDGTNSGLAQLVRDRDINVAIVATPDHLHFEQVRTLVDLGIHCLCVKPLVPTLQQHAALATLAQERSAHGVIEFHKRWDESNLLAKKLIAEGKLGRIHSISVDYSQRLMIPSEVFSGWVTRTNIFQYLGIHYVDLILWLTEAEPLRLCCRGTRGTLAARGIDTWDSVHVWLELRGRTGEDFLAQFNLSWVDSNLSPALSDQRFWVLGSTGRLDLDQRNRGIAATFQNQPMQYLNPWFSELLPTPDGGFEMQGYGYKSIAQFLRDTSEIINGQVGVTDLIGRRPTFQDCMASTRVIEAVTQCITDEYHDFVAL